MTHIKNTVVANRTGKLLAGFFFAMTAVLQVAIAQDESPTDSQQVFVNEMLKFKFEQQQPATVLTLEQQPLLKWSNPARNGEQGAVFLWTAAGQPAVFGTTFTYTYGGEVPRKNAFHVLTNAAISGTHNARPMWNPRKDSFAKKVFPGAPVPGTNATQRTTQLRLLARKFEVTLTTKDERQELCRLVPQPLKRFETNGGEYSGAIFSFAVGTDPEALLILDIQKDDNGAVVWHYAFARFTFYPLSAQLNGDTVWSVDKSTSLTSNILYEHAYHSEPYITFRSEWLD